MTAHPVPVPQHIFTCIYVFFFSFHLHSFIVLLTIRFGLRGSLVLAETGLLTGNVLWIRERCVGLRSENGSTRLIYYYYCFVGRYRNICSSFFCFFLLWHVYKCMYIQKFVLGCLTTGLAKRSPKFLGLSSMWVSRSGDAPEAVIADMNRLKNIRNSQVQTGFMALRLDASVHQSVCMLHPCLSRLWYTVIWTDWQLGHMVQRQSPEELQS